jgi:hypothetical protein
VVFYFLVTLDVPAVVPDPDSLGEPVDAFGVTLSETLQKRLVGVMVAGKQTWDVKHLMAGKNVGIPESSVLNELALWLRKRPLHIVFLFLAALVAGVAVGVVLGTDWKH